MSLALRIAQEVPEHRELLGCGRNRVELLEAEVLELRVERVEVRGGSLGDGHELRRDLEL